MNSYQQSSSSPSNGGQVRIVDQFNKVDLQFISENVQIYDEAGETSLSGFCDRTRTGSVLRWAIYSGDRNEPPLMEGQSQCSMGQFAVELKGLETVVCGVDHLIVAEGSWGGVASSHFSRRCQPLVSELIDPPEGSPHGTVCTLEFSYVTDQAKGPCMQVCYRDDKLTFASPVDENRCSSLAAQLTGP